MFWFCPLLKVLALFDHVKEGDKRGVPHPESVEKPCVEFFALGVWCQNAVHMPLRAVWRTFHNVALAVFHLLVGHPLVRGGHSLWFLPLWRVARGLASVTWHLISVSRGVGNKHLRESWSGEGD